jgi:predicted enzyme related to lactoylglutathione lyase
MSATVATVRQGRFVWRDVMTTDPAKAEAFYTALFAWTVQAHDMGEGAYRMFCVGDEPFGGIVPVQPGESSRWLSNVAVEDIEQATAKAISLGAELRVPPMDIPGIGRFSVVSDPTGADISPFEPLPGMEFAPLRPNPPLGAITWNEVWTPDPAAAIAFYQNLLGYAAERMDMAGAPYTVLKNAHQWAGVMQQPEGMPRSAWLIYFRVADVARALADIARLGGQPLFEIIPVPGFGQVSWALDPTGAMFGIHTPE